MRLSLTLSSALVALVSLTQHVAANAEKVIFLGPEARPIPLTKPTISDLNLPTLTPENTTIRTNLSRVFANEAEGKPKGESTWLLLDNLTEGQRYEFRVCWAAIEPTDFTMDVYDLSTVWDTPDLMVSLASCAYARMPEPDLDNPESKSSSGTVGESGERTASVMFLHVQAAADYFTDNVALMQNPPPVLVDLILDPYLYNVLPQSLLPTLGYIIGVAVVSWFAARSMASALRKTALGSSQGADDKKKR